MEVSSPVQTAAHCTSVSSYPLISPRNDSTTCNSSRLTGKDIGITLHRQTDAESSEIAHRPVPVVLQPNQEIACRPLHAVQHPSPEIHVAHRSVPVVLPPSQENAHRSAIMPHNPKDATRTAQDLTAKSVCTYSETQQSTGRHMASEMQGTTGLCIASETEETTGKCIVSEMQGTTGRCIASETQGTTCTGLCKASVTQATTGLCTCIASETRGTTGRRIASGTLGTTLAYQDSETCVINNREDTKREKSSYEIAAEALCLMKSGSLTLCENTQALINRATINRNLPTIENTQADINLAIAGDNIQAIENMQAQIHYAAALENPAALRSCTSLGNTQLDASNTTDSDNTQVEISPVEKVVESSCELSQEDERSSTVTHESNVTSPCTNSISFLPTTPVNSSSDAPKESAKYVLIPESALLSQAKPGELVAVPGTPYFLVVLNKDKVATASKRQKLQELYSSSGGNSPLTVAASSDLLPVTVNNAPQLNVHTYTRLSKRKRRILKKHDTLKFPPCIICEGEASGFHYGCNTCEACKNFFRRCLLRKTTSPFVCHSRKNCEISFKKNKNNCSACRLDKCLEMGMAKEKCKMGRYTALMRTETIKKVRKLEGKDEEYLSNESSPVPNSSDDCSQVVSISPTACSSASSSQVTNSPAPSSQVASSLAPSSQRAISLASSSQVPISLASSSELTSSLASSSQVTSPPAPNSQVLNSPVAGSLLQKNVISSPKGNTGERDIYGVLISKQIYSATDNIPDSHIGIEYNEELMNYLVAAMDDIKPWGENLVTEESRNAVIKEHYEKYKAKVETFGPLNAVPMHEYQVLLRKYNIDIDGQWAMFKQWSVDWESTIERYCAFAKCIPEFRSLSFHDQACLLKSTHCDFFMIALHQGYSPQYGVFLEMNGVPYHIEEAADKFFTRKLIVYMTDMVSQLQKMNLSKSEMALLISVVTMSSDQCKLENPQLVERTQLHLADLLLADLSRTLGQVAGRKRFTSLIDALINMREVSNVYYKEYRALCKDELIRQAVPNMDCVLPDDD